jgi:hypothetical protein
MKAFLVYTALFALCPSLIAQSVHDLEKEKSRMRMTVAAFTPEGVLCSVVPLEKNKLGREVPSKSSPSTDPFGGAGFTVLVIDITGMAAKAGDSRDVWLYPASATGSVARYAYGAANALLDRQGKFEISITPALLEKCAFEAELTHASGKTLMKARHKGAAVLDPFAPAGGGSIRGAPMDPFGHGEEIILLTPTQARTVKLYPTPKPNVFSLTVADAMKTFQGAR